MTTRQFVAVIYLISCLGLTPGRYSVNRSVSPALRAVEVRVTMVKSNDEVFTTWTKELDDAHVSIVYLCGELDASSVPTLLGNVHEIVSGSRNIIMDTHLLSYIDSTGLGALLSIKQALRDSGRGLCIAGAHGLLPRILQVTRADAEFRCYEDVEEALAEANSSDW